MTNVKYIGNKTKKSENEKIHIKKGAYTACGIRIGENPKNWYLTIEQVTCNKKGCKKIFKKQQKLN